MAAPGRPRRLGGSRLLGLAIPAVALVAGVVIAQLAGGADFLTALAAVATPLLAAGAGWARRWPLPWLPALCVPPLYALAWLRPDTLGTDAAGTALIAGACLAITGLVAGLAPPSWLTAGLVLLVVLDAILVWGDRQVEPTMTALQAAVPPAPAGRPLPDSSRSTSAPRPWAGSTSRRPRSSACSSGDGSRPRSRPGSRPRSGACSCSSRHRLPRRHRCWRAWSRADGSRSYAAGATWSRITSSSRHECSTCSCASARAPSALRASIADTIAWCSRVFCR